jgi:hypothetical protein
MLEYTGPLTLPGYWNLGIFKLFVCPIWKKEKKKLKEAFLSVSWQAR